MITDYRGIANVSILQYLYFYPYGYEEGGFKVGRELLSIVNLNKRFESAGGHVQALYNVDLDVQEGEFITVIGPSGCGKSTLLRIVAGLDRGFTGSVTLGGRRLAVRGLIKVLFFRSIVFFPGLPLRRISPPIYR